MLDLAKKIGIKTFKICGNEECSPLAPLTGIILKRVYFIDKERMRCPVCKSTYNIRLRKEYTSKDDPWDVCPKCKVKFKEKKRWYLQCPNCGRCC